MRIGSEFALQKRDCNFDSCEIRISEQIVILTWSKTEKCTFKLSGHVWNTERKKLSNFVSLNFNRFQVFFVTIYSSLHAFNIRFSMKVMLSESAVITCFSAVFFFLMFNVNFGTFLSWVILFHIKTLSLEKKIAWKKQREERKNFFAYKFILSVLWTMTRAAAFSQPLIGYKWKWTELIDWNLTAKVA